MAIHEFNDGDLVTAFEMNKVAGGAMHPVDDTRGVDPAAAAALVSHSHMADASFGVVRWDAEAGAIVPVSSFSRADDHIYWKSADETISSVGTWALGYWEHVIRAGGTYEARALIGVNAATGPQQVRLAWALKSTDTGEDVTPDVSGRYGFGPAMTGVGTTSNTEMRPWGGDDITTHVTYGATSGVSSASYHLIDERVVVKTPEDAILAPVLFGHDGSTFVCGAGSVMMIREIG